MGNAARKMKILNISTIEAKAARVAEAYAIAQETKEKNRETRKTNDLLRLPDKLRITNDKWVIQAINNEQANKRRLLKVKPETWRAFLDSLEEPLKTKLGCIIWWDFFGARRVTKRWPHLDDILANYDKLDDYPDFSRDELILALCNAGYSAYEASKRISESETDE